MTSQVRSRWTAWEKNELGEREAVDYPEFTLEELLKEIEDELVEMIAPRPQGNRGKDKQKRKQRFPIAGFTRGPY